MSGKPSHGGKFDWKLVNGDYVKVYEGLDLSYGQVYTKSARALARMAGLAQGEMVVDLGCGTGLSTAVFAQAVGPKGRVIGQDVNPEMMAVARTRLKDTPWCSLVLADLADFGQTSRELNLAGQVDAVLSSFSYFYMYDFHERLQAQVFQALKPGGRLGFNVGTFLSQVEYKGRTYNTFTGLFDQTLDRLLRERGYSAGLAPTPPRPVPMFTTWDLSILERTGYREIKAQPWPLPMSARRIYEYSIEGFHAQGMGFPSQTLMALDQQTRVKFLEETLARCGEEMDRQGLRSHILNVVATK